MRDVKLDSLRGIGLLCIILAHVDPPYVIEQLRSFDVPLMVFISGSVTKRIETNLITYYCKRVARLIIPVYLFITGLFILYWLGSQFGFIKLMNDFPKVVFNTYLLSPVEGVGYVWIIRVFLLMMLITPIVVKITNVVFERFWLYFLIIALLGIFNINIINSDICQKSNVFDEIFRNIIQYILGYGLVLMTAIKLQKTTIVERKRYVLTLLLLFVSSVIYYIVSNGFIIDISKFYKYPPQWYFLIYGLLCSVLLCSYVSRLPRSLIENKILVFIGQNSIWLYLWHIPFIKISNFMFSEWYIRWGFILFFSLIVYLVQYKIAKKYLKNSNCLKYLIG